MKNLILRKPVLWALVLLASALAVGTYFLRRALTPAEMQKPAVHAVTVEAQLVEIAPFISQLIAVGTLVANDSITIKPEMDGVISKIVFESGQIVKEGQLLYQLDDSLSKAQLNEAQAQLKLATLDYNRAKQLAEEKFVSTKELDKLFATFEVYKAQTEAAKAKLEKTQIRAPFDGIIGINSWGIGAYVRTGEELVSLVNIDPMKVDFRIGEEYLQRLKEGQAITVKVDGFEEIFDGTITAIEPNIDPLGHSILIRAHIKNPDKKLRPGLFASITLTLHIEEEAIFVPESALESEGGLHFVYRVVDGVSVKTPVTIGGYEKGRVYISEGLWRTDVVVTAGGLRIGEGTSVKIVDSPSKNSPSKQETSEKASPTPKTAPSTKEESSTQSSPSEGIDYHTEYQSLLEESEKPTSSEEQPSNSKKEK